MAYISQLLFDFAPHIHYVSFALLVLAGFNFPISEDIIFIISASIAATIIPEHTFKIAAGCVLGAYTSDIISYCLGRFGMKFILEHKQLAKFYPLDKIRKIKYYYQSHGAKTLFFGRFIPFGVRNVIFLTSGLAKMKIYKFLLIDLLSLSITSTILFSIGYRLGSNYEIIFPYLNKYKFIIFSLFILTVLSIIIYKKNKQ